MSDAQHFPAADLARRTGDVLDAAGRAPVTITRHRKPRFVLMSVERYEAMISGGGTQRVYTIDDMPPEMKAAMVAALKQDLTASEAVRENKDDA